MKAEPRDTSGFVHGRRVLGTVRDAMTTDLVLIRAEERLGAALLELERAGVSGAPVVDGEAVVGVVSREDLLAVVPKGAVIATTGPFHRWETYLDEQLPEARVHQVMHGWNVTVTAETPIAEAARTLVANDMTRVPVVDEAGRPVGILSRQDIVSALARS